LEAYLRKSTYIHFRFLNTNSGGFFQSFFFYLKPQGHQIWAYIYPNICRCMLTFSICSI